MRAVIFVGPSLPPNVRPDLGLDIDWRPPVRQGELHRAALDWPAIIGVIDGYFEVTPTVWHKEILWAMAQGIYVYGSGSIGALRAAELEHRHHLATRDENSDSTVLSSSARCAWACLTKVISCPTLRIAGPSS